MSKLKVAVVGAGFVAEQKHLPILSKCNKVDLVAICDVNYSVAQLMAQKFGVAKIYDDIEEMLNSVSPDIVDLCTPPNTHVDIGIKAIRSHCHVLMEKPMALNSQDCARLIKVAKEYNTKLCVVHNMLFHPPLVVARRLVEEGRIGSVLGIWIFVSNPVQRRTAVEEDWVHQLPGGLIGETGPHIAYLSLPFIGPVRDVQVWATKHTKYPWCLFDDYRIQLIGERATSSIVALYASNQWAVDLEVYGTDGTLKIDLQAMTIVVQNRAQRTPKEIAVTTVRRNVLTIGEVLASAFRVAFNRFKSGHEKVILDFVDAIIANRPSPVPGEDGTAAVAVVERIVKALEEIDRTHMTDRWNKSERTS